MLVNARRRCVLHHMRFKAPVTACRFSPDGAFFAVTVGKLLQARGRDWVGRGSGRVSTQGGRRTAAV